jgi:hypothetical protein
VDRSDSTGRVEINPLSHLPRPPIANVTLVGQQLAQAFGAAQALLHRLPTEPDRLITELRQWYYRQHPADRARLLWQRFVDAEETCHRLESVIQIAQQALDAERAALAQAETERAALAVQPLPTTVGRRRPMSDQILSGATGS